MKAPDKIYVAISHPISKNYIEMTGFMERGSNDKIEYIRKDYLLEWLEQELAQRRQWFERYEDAEDLHACNELAKIINKLNEM